MSLADKAKLLLIPSGYKTGKVYSVFPTNGDGDFTFSRTGEATRINPGGLIETVATQVPRIDHYGGGCPSLLLQPQRTNIQIRSQEFDNASWSKINSTVTANDTISPSGEINADKLTSTTSLNNYVFDQHSLSISTNYSMSIFAKKGTSNEIQIDLEDFTSGTQGRAKFNLDTETITNEVGNASFKNYGNGWYRIIVDFTTSAVLGTHYFRIFTIDGTSGSDIYIYGAQLEEGAYSTSYIPTVGGSATRVWERCIDSGNADIFNDDEGVLYLETKGLFTALNGYLSLYDGAIGTYTNHIIFQYRTDGNFRVWVGGLGGSNINFLITNFDLSENHKIAFQYQSLTDNKLFIDGVEQTKYVSFIPTTLSGLNRLDFTINNNNSLAWEGRVKDLRYYDTTLTDTELQELTTL